MRHRLLLSTLVLALLVGGMLIPLPAGAVPIIAYDVPSPQPGNQSFTGSLGLDFDVNAPIQVTQLGVFDSNGDGISTLGVLNAAIFDRNSTTLPVAGTLQTFSVPLGQGMLQNGSRFKDLLTPVTLQPGQYSIVAWGFGPNDLNGNSVCVGNAVATCFPTNPFALSTENNGGGLISFVGTGRFDATPGLYPTALLSGTPSNVFNAGTFTYDAVPEPMSLLLLGSGLAGLGLLGLRRRSRRRGAQA